MQKKDKISVLVTGSNGQLGLSFINEAEKYNDVDFYFYDSSQLDITDLSQISKITKSTTFDYCLNFAAYTNVEQAENEPDKAFSVNCRGVENLVETFKNSKTTLIHISTDYVFDGKKKTSYTEKDAPNPINKYGKSKFSGEKIILEQLDKYYIIRTSWLYSTHGNNFFNTIVSKLLKGEKLHVSKLQKGSPTSTSSLCKALIHVIRKDKKKYGIFHFSNKGLTNWYIFAKKIIELIDSKRSNQLFEIEEYKTKAKRPENSKLNSSKFEKTFDYKINDWKKELKDVVFSQWTCL